MLRKADAILIMSGQGTTKLRNAADNSRTFSMPKAFRTRSICGDRRQSRLALVAEDAAVCVGEASEVKDEG